MKALPIFAVVVIGAFAVLGFAAGTWATVPQKAAASLPADKEQASNQSPEADADTILRAAEARRSAGPAATDGASLVRDAGAVDHPAPDADASPAHLVKMANVTFPVRKTASVSFVVADMAVAVRDAESAARYEIPENAARLQAAIKAAMARAAETPALRGVTIDSQTLSGKLTTALQQDFTDVEDVLFLTLYKHDVGYN